MARLEKRKRIVSRTGKDVGIAEEIFEGVAEFREEGPDLIALPAYSFATGLRLYAMNWGNKTVVWLGFADKQGWHGSWQTHPDTNFRPQVFQYASIRKILQDRVDSGELLVNDGECGFRRFSEASIPNVLQIF